MFDAWCLSCVWMISSKRRLRWNNKGSFQLKEDVGSVGIDVGEGGKCGTELTLLFKDG